jgi:uncharacterized cupredoxin-like copper-binding protein
VSAAVAAGIGAMQGFAGSATATVSVAVKEFSLTPAVKKVPAGNVRFVVRNTGRVDHQLVVLRTKRPANKLYLATTRDVFEIGRVGKTKPIDAGRTKTLTLTLKPGHYALICNLPGHYRAGQFADFTAR